MSATIGNTVVQTLYAVYRTSGVEAITLTTWPRKELWCCEDYSTHDVPGAEHLSSQGGVAVGQICSVTPLWDKLMRDLFTYFFLKKLTSS